MGRIVLLLYPLSVIELFRLQDFVKSQKELDNLLQHLHALLVVPKDGPVQPLHLSFRDFLLDPKRCLDNRFWVNERKMHRNLTLACTRLLSSFMRRNICSLPSVGTLISEVDQSDINNALPPAVQYACQFWVDHVEKGESASLDLEIIDKFLRQHFLHWLEAMSSMKMYLRRL